MIDIYTICILNLVCSHVSETVGSVKRKKKVKTSIWSIDSLKDEARKYKSLINFILIYRTWYFLKN
jgi:hypothetical protein